jgi:hypothetical protein
MPKSAVGKLIKAIYLAVVPALVDKDYHELTLTSDARLRTDASIVGPIVVTPAEPVLTPAGYQQILGVTNLVATPLVVPPGAKYAWVQIENGDSRWRDDGPAPTAAIGFPLLQDTGFFFQDGAGGLAALKFIAQTVPINVNVVYYS